MSMTKEQARVLVDIANRRCPYELRRGDYKLPRRWTPQEVSRLCELVCDMYSAYPSNYPEITREVESDESARRALLKEKRQVEDVLRALKKIRAPRLDMQQARKAVEVAMQSIEKELQECEFEHETFKLLPARTKKKGVGRHTSTLALLMHDLAAALRCVNKAARPKHIAGEIHKMLGRHGLLSRTRKPSIETIEQTLRNATQLKN